MAIIYSISDIHGFYEEMIETLHLVDLESDKENQLILLGDYVDRGTDSCQVLYHLKELEEKYPRQVKTLLGNHDKMFLDWYTTLEDESQWLMYDFQLLTLKSFFSKQQFEKIENQPVMRNGSYIDISKFLVGKLNEEHSQLLKWLLEKDKCPPYYETENQIYVHAGVCEVDEELWKQATEPREFFWKYPAETGVFYKDIIAGHVSTVDVSKNNSYLGKVYWDTYSHFYIDGETVRSKVVPLLKYDTETRLYSSFERDSDGGWGGVYGQYR